MFKPDSDMLNVNSNVKLEMETTKPSQNISFLMEETQQKIEVVSRKFNILISGVFESLEREMPENKGNRTEMSKKLRD